MQRFSLLIILLVTSSIVVAANLGQQFVFAKLAYGATVSLPKSWQVPRGNEMRAIETSVGAALDLSGYAKQLDGVEILVVAIFPDPELYAGVTITSLATPGVTPALPASLSDAQVKAGESIIRQGIEASQAKLGTKIYGWSSLKKIVIGGSTVMYTSYLRSSDVGERRVHLYKFFGTGRIFDLALSTSAKHESANGVVLEKIASSFVAP